MKKQVTIIISDTDLALLDIALAEKEWSARRDGNASASINYKSVRNRIKNAFHSGRRVD